MNASDALRSVFDDGDGAPTRVTVHRAVAEHDLRVDILTQDEFTAWFDRAGDRILASARRKRRRATGLEDVTIAPGDLLPAGGTDFDDEARVIAIGEAVEDVDPLFVGSLGAALDFVLGRGEIWQREVCIWTEAWLYGPRDFGPLADERRSVSASRQSRLGSSRGGQAEE